jgi:hypothetical protein
MDHRSAAANTAGGASEGVGALGLAGAGVGRGLGRLLTGAGLRRRLAVGAVAAAGRGAFATV